MRLLLALLLLGTFALRAWSASDRLNNSRHFDERFTLRNVAVILVHGGWRPANAFYGSLSYLPQTAALAVSEGLHKATGIEALSVFDERASDGWSATAYRVARGVSVLFGTLHVLAVFWIGRRLFDPWIGLLAAALVAALPAHVVSSALIKPDILVALLVAVTFLWSLSAVERPSARRFALAGVGIGLAVAAKYTGVGVAIPLTVGALLMPAEESWSRWRRWWLLGLAALASLVTFLVLHPHMALVVEYLPRLWGIMESKGEATGGSHWTVVALEGRYLLRHHRWPVLLLAVAGTLAALVTLLRRDQSRGRGLGRGRDRGEAVGDSNRLQFWMTLSYLFGYSALYAAATKLFKGQNYLPVTAFTAALAAWAAIAAWRWAAERTGFLRQPAVALLCWGFLLSALFHYPVSTTYHQVVPSTWTLAERFLAEQLRPAAHRYLYYEKRDTPLRLARDGHRLIAIPVGRLADVPSQELNYSDAELFEADRLGEDPSDFYLRRAARPRYHAERFNPRWFRAHGPGLAVLLHGWQPAAEPETLTLEEVFGKNRYRAVLSNPLAAGELISLQIRMPINRRVQRPAQVQVNRATLPLYETKSSSKKAHEITARMALDADANQLVLTFERRLEIEWVPEVTLLRWSQP